MLHGHRSTHESLEGRVVEEADELQILSSTLLEAGILGNGILQVAHHGCILIGAAATMAFK